MKSFLIKSFFLSFFLAIVLFPVLASAKIGVGVGTGKIVVDDKLKPGTIYELPSLTVFNTGDVKSDYGVNIALHEKQKELQPQESWFIFSPATFSLEPGAAQEVTIKLNLPLKTEPGRYFAYLEGHPAAKAENGDTKVGIAAAAKLYFTVVPGNFFEGIYFKIVSFAKVYAPWPQRAVTTIVILLVLFLFKKFFNVEINLKKQKDE